MGWTSNLFEHFCFVYKSSIHLSFDRLGFLLGQNFEPIQNCEFEGFQNYIDWS